MKKLVLLFCCLISFSAIAEVMVENYWIRPSPTKMTAGYVTLTADSNIALVSANSPLINKIEFHTHEMQNGIATMRQIEQIDLPAKQSIQLQPKGLHLMLFGLEKPASENPIVPITLFFSDNTSVEIDFPIQHKAANH